MVQIWSTVTVAGSHGIMLLFFPETRDQLFLTLRNPQYLCEDNKIYYRQMWFNAVQHSVENTASGSMRYMSEALMIRLDRLVSQMYWRLSRKSRITAHRTAAEGRPKVPVLSGSSDSLHLGLQSCGQSRGMPALLDSNTFELWASLEDRLSSGKMP